MPNCDFYAARLDFLPILDYVFECGDFEVYEKYSEFEKELQQFRSTDDVRRHFQVGKWENSLKLSVHMALYPKKAHGKFVIERISVAPEFCNGATYRYRASGWGLIQLYLGEESLEAIRVSHTNHNSEKRASGYAWLHSELGNVSTWDWSEVVRCSSRLNYQIRKLSTRKIESRCILPEAKALLSSGLKMKQ